MFAMSSGLSVVGASAVTCRQSLELLLDCASYNNLAKYEQGRDAGAKVHAR